jgi:D-amino-acid dehydrogenase
MSTAPGRVVVIGSGVIGTACAYYLMRRGWTVTVIDSGEFGRGCSHGNCGFVCPSHVLPLAAPGAVRNALRALFTPGSPLSIKPRLNLGLWTWFYRFARRCNVKDMMEAARGIAALLNSSRGLYPELLQTEAIECEWEAKGLLFVFQTRAAMEHAAETEKLLSDSFGLTARRFSGEELVELEPALKSGLAGGFLHETDAHLRPDKLMTGWKQALERLGVNVRARCYFTGFAGAGYRATEAQTSEGELRGDAFVVATGAWTPLLNRQLGCRIPIEPGKGYSITMPRPSRCPSLPLIFEEHRVAVTPMRAGYRLGSTMEFAGFDASLKPCRLDLLRDGARPYLHEPYSEPVLESWFGWRPMTPNGLPIIDRVPAYRNVLIAAGHNMLGLSMAPATGKLVAEILSGDCLHIDPAPYEQLSDRPDRGSVRRLG